MNKIKSLLLVLLLLALHGKVTAQRSPVPMDQEYWETRSSDFKFQKYRGIQGLYLGDGQATLKDVVFENGIIEFDIAFPLTRGFPGIKFRIQDDANYEELYLRPHQSGNPDANQYTPVFNGLAGWQLYYGEGHAAPVKYNFDYNVNGWNHVKLVIHDSHGEVYINNMDSPLFQIYELKHNSRTGAIALKGGAKAVFANFSYTSSSKSLLKLPPKDLPATSPDIITDWEVSSAFDESSLKGVTKLVTKELNELKWDDHKVEFTGILNVAKVTGKVGKKNTVLVKLRINADKNLIKRMDFGFSDRALVYLNKNLVYAGSNMFGSRDYRYLGTIGFFDSLYLSLKKGNNEIIFALSENFGGWGLKAKLENFEGISIAQ